MKKETFKTNDLPMTEAEIQAKAIITKKDAEIAFSQASVSLKEYIDAEDYRKIDRNYTLE
jgi:hypothetical protein